MATKKAWSLPKAGRLWISDFLENEEKYNLPRGLLGRIAQQESSFDPNAKSSAGALGLMQFMPATAKWMEIDPFNPSQAIEGAAKYLKYLHKKFKSWPLALAAYNWGEGNLARKGIENAPSETKKYVADISSDIGLV